MRFFFSVFLPLLPALSAAAVIPRQNGDGPQGSTDSTQGDLGARPPPRFPFPVTKFPVPIETVVLTEAMYILPGQIFDGQMRRYERVEGSCSEQAEGTDADAVFNLLPGATIRNVVIGKHQSEGIHALGDAWVENGETLRTTPSIDNLLTCVVDSLVGRRLRRRFNIKGPEYAAPCHWRRRTQRNRQDLPGQLVGRKGKHHRLLR